MSGAKAIIVLNIPVISLIETVEAALCIGFSFRLQLRSSISCASREVFPAASTVKAAENDR